MNWRLQPRHLLTWVHMIGVNYIYVSCLYRFLPGIPLPEGERCQTTNPMRTALQADALKLVAKKLQSSLAIEGKLPEDGLAAYGDDLMMALARKIVSAEQEEAETVEEVFAAAKDVESTAEELLVDDGWKAVEIEPETLPICTALSAFSTPAIPCPSRPRASLDIFRGRNR